MPDQIASDLAGKGAVHPKPIELIEENDMSIAATIDDTMAAHVKAGAVNGSKPAPTWETDPVDVEFRLMDVEGETRTLWLLSEENVLSMTTGDRKKDAAIRAFNASVNSLEDSVEALRQSMFTDAEYAVEHEILHPEDALTAVKEDVCVLRVITREFFAGPILEHRSAYRIAWRLEEYLKIVEAAMFPAREQVPAS